MSIFIIEHLEPELYPWCIIEYKSISKIVGRENLIFTNVAQKDVKKLSGYGLVFIKSVKKMKLKNTCVLDPEAKTQLNPKDKADYFIFGGILGDDPPRKRTGVELTKFIPNAKQRNIGKQQLSTDNAVFTVNKIINEHKYLKDLKFQDSVEIKKNKIESFILPYRYNLANGRPFICKELIEFLKKKKNF